jgi:hypothetical protein
MFLMLACFCGGLLFLLLLFGGFYCVYDMWSGSLGFCLALFLVEDLPLCIEKFVLVGSVVG